MARPTFPLRVALLGCVLLNVGAATGSCSKPSTQAIQRPHGFGAGAGVTREQAISIARNSLAKALGGPANADRFAPFRVEPKGDNWVVEGDPHLPPNETGGGPMVEVSRSSGKVVSLKWGA